MIYPNYSLGLATKIVEQRLNYYVRRITYHQWDITSKAVSYIPGTGKCLPYFYNQVRILDIDTEGYDMYSQIYAINVDDMSCM